MFLTCIMSGFDMKLYKNLIFTVKNAVFILSGTLLNFLKAFYIVVPDDRLIYIYIQSVV